MHNMQKQIFGSFNLVKNRSSCSYTKEEYKQKLDKLQRKAERLHGELYRKRIPVVIGFEGWDAAGKGGAIKRLTEKNGSSGICGKSDSFSE